MNLPSRCRRPTSRMSGPFPPALAHGVCARASAINNANGCVSLCLPSHDAHRPIYSTNKGPKAGASLKTRPVYGTRQIYQPCKPWYRTCKPWHRTCKPWHRRALTMEDKRPPKLAKRRPTLAAKRHNNGGKETCSGRKETYSGGKET